MPDWLPFDQLQPLLELLVSGLVSALFLGWLAGAIGLLGNVTRR